MFRVPKQAPSRRLIESSSVKTWYGTDLAEQYGAHGLKAMGLDRLLMVRSYRGDERQLCAVSHTRVLGSSGAQRTGHPHAAPGQHSSGHICTGLSLTGDVP